MFIRFARNHWRALAAYVILDTLAVGAGMGVPIFPILFGFVVGWFIPRILAAEYPDLRQLLRKSLAASLATPGLTFLLMLVIWGPISRMLMDPVADIANFGIPMILYEPTASFTGWLVLMIFISPFLQALATAFSAMARMAWLPPRGGAGDK
jgi:hypothetical protein